VPCAIRQELLAAYKNAVLYYWQFVKLPVMVFAEYLAVGTANAEARITALQVFSDGSSKELWSRNGFLPPAADAIAPAIADIDGDGQPEIIFEAVHRNPDGAGGQIGVFRRFRTVVYSAHGCVPGKRA